MLSAAVVILMLNNIMSAYSSCLQYRAFMHGQWMLHAIQCDSGMQKNVCVIFISLISLIFISHSLMLQIKKFTGILDDESNIKGVCVV